jgi:hypothetical protein
MSDAGNLAALGGALDVFVVVWIVATVVFAVAFFVAFFVALAIDAVERRWPGIDERGFDFPGAESQFTRTDDASLGA